MKLKRGDEVIISIGKDRGKKGKIEKIFPKIDKIVVAGVNIYKRHLKSRGEKNPGGIIDITKSIPAANVRLVCPKCHQPTRVGYKTHGSEKFRFCKKCEQTI